MTPAVAIAPPAREKSPAEPDTPATFTRFSLHPSLRQGIQDMGYETPTPIQAQAIPPMLEGRDLIGCAQTGTGKTAAYLLPILHRLLARPGAGCRVLILAPTRELALQIDEQILALGYHTGLSGAAVVGGMEMNPQERAIRAGVDFITATPGRLLDHIGRGYLDLSAVEVLVVDEADRMLDMGFLPDLMRIVGRLPRNRQTLLFSATMPPEVIRLTRDVMRDPVTVRIGLSSAPAAGVTHTAYPVPAHRKEALLLTLLQGRPMPSVLIFTRTKIQADRLARTLRQAGLPVARIHSNRSQEDRLAALEGFRRGTYRILVATDIAARGLDVNGISHVINFDLPQGPDDYIHRIGRTARAEATGEAFTLVTPDDEADMAAIDRALGRPVPRVTLPGFAYGAPPGAAASGSRRRRAGERDAGGRRPPARDRRRRRKR